MKYLDDTINIVCDVLVLQDRKGEFDASTGLIGVLPEFDSMAVVSIITALEDEFGCTIEDDEISAEVFETVGTLAIFVESKVD
ncbi:acyl carrier protein [Bowmanella dokdonensis]|uniref:Acyl carrier protein n=1 Tax=Bowmanella dokdonensis TaxID=751969 RepID=A0A939DS30_9ALTE|nr:phosphopantetheine-binding protein [Bowmanella dokdonensis]MBN7827322.1 acyl carrier protein [Bowmanella dokdonensis]